MQQLPEIVMIDGVLHTLYTAPLLPWLRAQNTPPVFDQRTPNCERGYIGSWKISNDVLWLTSLYAWRNGELTTLSHLFPNQREVEAEWFSGLLMVEPAASEISDGAPPKQRTLHVEAGRVVGVQDGFIGVKSVQDQ
jgi:hypothetical protein